MGGGLMQLVAQGSQDVYLTGNPQITFFKMIYKRHTNFAIETFPVLFDSELEFGTKISVDLDRKGDLLSQIFLYLELPKLPSINISGEDYRSSYINAIGNYIIEYIEIEIGGQRIDRIYGEWMNILSELIIPESKIAGYNDMIGRYSVLSYGNNLSNDVWEHIPGEGPMKLYIPIPFWFCNHIGLSLPLVALQYHDVIINLKLRDFNEVFYNKTNFMDPENKNMVSPFSSSNTPKITGHLLCDYIYLDTDERKRFAQMSHEYLITQLQFNGDDNILKNTDIKNIPLQFNHPIKELFWVVQTNSSEKLNDRVNYSLTIETEPIGIDGIRSISYLDPIEYGTLFINGHERFPERRGLYFRLVQPYQKHTRIPSEHIYIYSFGIKPEEMQPSGTCNFSRIDSAQFTFRLVPNIPNSKIRVYALNYNVLRIMSGMAGLAYTN